MICLRLGDYIISANGGCSTLNDKTIFNSKILVYCCHRYDSLLLLFYAFKAVLIYLTFIEPDEGVTHRLIIPLFSSKVIEASVWSVFDTMSDSEM